MTTSWKLRLTSLAVATTLATVAGACSTGDTGSATSAIDSAQSDQSAQSEASQPADPSGAGPEPTTGPVPTTEPASAGVDRASFEPFDLPDYAAAALTDDYDSYLVEVEPGVNVHVLEVGSGYPVYLQHGAPTSGFLYRKIAALLPLDRFRLIMPTMVGLGFSTQVPAEQHTLANHVRWMNEVLTQRQLDELIYVGHDWGGPVGLGALERSPELLSGAVVLNTALGAPTGPVELNPQLQAILAPLPEDAEFAVSVGIFDQLAGVQNDPESLSSEVLDLYRRPIAESDNGVGPLNILRMAATGPEHPTAEVLRAIDVYVANLDVPAEIVWGVNDPLLGDRLDEVMAVFPNAPVTRTDSGHFLQEEAGSPEEIAAAIERIHEQVTAQ